MFHPFCDIVRLNKICLNTVRFNVECKKNAKEYCGKQLDMVALPPPCDARGTFILKSHWRYLFNYNKANTGFKQITEMYCPISMEMPVHSQFIPSEARLRTKLKMLC